MASRNKQKHRNAKKVKEEVKVKWYPLAWLDNKTNWLAALLLILPLLYSSKTADPTLTIRFIFEVIFIAAYTFYFYIVRGSKLSFQLPKLIKWFFYLSVIYLGWSIVGAFYTINVQLSIYEISRMALNLLLVFLVIQIVMDETFKLTYLLGTLLVSCFVHSFIGLDQVFEWGFSKIPGTASPYGLMVNRNLYGSFQVLFLPVMIYLVATKKGFFKWVSILVFAVLVASIVYSDTRAAWLSSMIIAVIIVLLVSIYAKELRQSVIKTTLAGSLLVLFMIAPGVIKKQMDKPEKTSVVTSPVPDTEAESTLADAQMNKKGKKKRDKKPDLVVGESVNERLVVWKESSKMIAAHPMMGVGIGNWKIVVPNFKIGGIRNDYGKIIRIRPHNIYLQTISETGVIGFVIYYASWVLLLIMAFKLIVGYSKSEDRLLVILLLCGLVGFAIDGLFSFPMERIAHSVTFSVLMGLIIGLFANAAKVQEEPIEGFKYSRFLALFFLIFLGWNVFLGFEKFRFNNHIRRAKVLVDKKENERTIRETELGKSRFVSVDLTGEPLEMVSAVAYHNLKKFDEAMVEVVKAEKYNPYSTRILNTKGTIYTNQKKYKEAIECFKGALIYSPKYDVSLKNLALNYYYNEQYAESIETLGLVDIEGDEKFTKLLNVAKRKLELQEAAATTTSE